MVKRQREMTPLSFFSLIFADYSTEISFLSTVENRQHLLSQRNLS